MTACVGPKQAILATAHKLLHTIYSILWDDHALQGPQGGVTKMLCRNPEVRSGPRGRVRRFRNLRIHPP